MKNIFFLLSFLSTVLFSFAARADWILNNFDTNSAPQTTITLPWVSPVTGLPWVPNPNGDTVGFVGYSYGYGSPGQGESENWFIPNGYSEGDPAQPSDTWHNYIEANFGSMMTGAETTHHTGEDFNRYGGQTNQPVYAVNNGLVVFAGKPAGLNTMGYIVVIRHEKPKDIGNDIKVVHFQEGADYVEANHYSSDPGHDHGGKFKAGEVVKASVPHEIDCNSATFLDHGNRSTVYSYYLHLGTIEPGIQVGTPVYKGEQIGRLFEELNAYIDDATGAAQPTAYGAHLHFEIWDDLVITGANQVSDQAGYAPKLAFEQAPLVHPQCFYQLNNQGLYVSESGATETDRLKLYGNDFSLLDPNASVLSLWLVGEGLDGAFNLAATGGLSKDSHDNYYQAYTVSEGVGGLEVPVNKLMDFNAKYFATLDLQAGAETTPHDYFFPFFDVPGDNFYSIHVARLWSRDILEGYLYNNFGAFRKVNRAEFAAMLVRAMGLSTQAITTSCNSLAPLFVDVSAGDTHWYCPYFWALYQYSNQNPATNLAPNEERVIQGVVIDGQNHLNPGGVITREQAAKMLANAADLNVPASVMQTGFSDIDASGDPAISPSEWYGPYIWATREGKIFEGYEDGTFHINEQLTRAQAATVIDRALEQLQN